MELIGLFFAVVACVFFALWLVTSFHLNKEHERHLKSLEMSPKEGQVWGDMYDSEYVIQSVGANCVIFVILPLEGLESISQNDTWPVWHRRKLQKQMFLKEEVEK